MITENMRVYDVLEDHPELEKVFLEHNLLCQGCPGAATESLAEAAEGHGLDIKSLLNDLNKAIKEL